MARLTRANAAALVTRDWDRVSEAKADYWRKQQRSHRLDEILRLADDLRRHIIALRPDWANEAGRSADRASHERVAALLAKAAHVQRPAR